MTDEQMINIIRGKIVRHFEGRFTNLTNIDEDFIEDLFDEVNELGIDALMHLTDKDTALRLAEEAAMEVITILAESDRKKQ